ncbi:MAG: hypothetical protein KAU21_09470, partial [Gammaproteobacteria bacterium]|nr:hypothetical protein [Gammaproteobacteria bacterium]
MKIDSYVRYIFLAIAISISLFFGGHGYVVLEPKWGWPLAAATVIILEAVFLNVFLADAYSNVSKILVYAFGFFALIFSVSLPLISSWEVYQGIERVVIATKKTTEPEYYSKNVIPALEKE